MNTKRKIIVVTAIGIVALGVTTGWSVLAGAAWPPQPYQVSSIAGAWTILGQNTIVTISPEDQQSATGFWYATHINMDPTAGGAIPDATSVPACIGKYVRTGPNTWQYTGVAYFLKDTKPQSTILNIDVVGGTITMTTPGKIEWTKTNMFYLGAQDKDHDGLPDVGEKPILPPWNDPNMILKSL